MNNNRLLVVDDDQSFRGALVSALTGRGFVVDPAPNGCAALAWLVGNPCNLVLLDQKLPDMDGIDALRQIRDLRPEAQVVMLTGHGTIDNAVEAIRAGAFDYLTKPCPLDQVQLTLRKAQEHMRLVERTAALESALAPAGDVRFIGTSAAVQRIGRMIDRVAQTDSTLLVTGETGVGKELVARLVHSRSGRGRHPFVVVDCGNLPADQLQSELFGQEKGVGGFSELKHGLFEVAHKGSLFLDGVGDMPPPMQTSLLRVLETGGIRRVGSTQESTVDVRVIAATNRDLEQLTKEGQFREDLLYRLNAVRIDVPPLRERPEDIVSLVAHYVELLNRRLSTDKHVSAETMVLLAAYPWPGNVRQLVNTIEQAIVVSEGQALTPADLPEAFRRTRKSGPIPFQSSVVPLVDVERQYIEFAIRQMGGHRARAAKALGIGERSLYRKLKEFGIE